MKPSLYNKMTDDERLQHIYNLEQSLDTYKQLYALKLQIEDNLRNDNACLRELANILILKHNNDHAYYDHMKSMEEKYDKAIPTRGVNMDSSKSNELHQ